MSTEPLRRILFPTPRKNDDGTSSRSIQRIRPKPELTPVNLESTPTTFKQLVENSPVPLAVAAAKAAMRAAESAQNGRPIITEMTRAAEEVVKNSDYNAIRPPHVSPRPVPSASRHDNIPARSSSALLPPIPSPSTRPVGALSTFRRMFMRQQQARSWSSTPIPNEDDLPNVDENGGKMDGEEKKTPPSPVHVPRKHIPPIRQPNFVHSISGKRILKPGTVLGMQPSSQSKYDPLKRLFGSASPLRTAAKAETAETGPIGTISDDEHVENEKQTLSSYKTIEPTGKKQTLSSHKTTESIGKQPKKRPRAIARIETEIIIPEEELNASPAMRTRSAKRSRRASKASVTDDLSDAKPRKKRRMSEVLRLQKALESAAWTNSVAVEKQTEVIVVSDRSPDPPRLDVSIKFENKTKHNKGAMGKSVSVPVRRKIKLSTKQSAPKKTARTNGIKQKLITKQKSDGKSNSFGKRTVNATKRQGNFIQKSVKENPAVRGKVRAVDGSLQDLTQKTSRKVTRQKKGGRLQRLETDVAADKRRANKKEIAEKHIEASGAANSADTRIPLKKRHTPTKKKDRSPLEAVTNTSVPCVDAKQEDMTRKSPHPRRLSAPANNTEGHGTAYDKSKETSSTIATSPAHNLDPGCSKPALVDGLRERESYTDILQPERSRPQRGLEEKRSQTTDSEATLSEAARL